MVGRNAKGVESLVQASAAEAEAMSAALAAAEARAAAAARESTGEAGGTVGLMQLLVESHQHLHPQQLSLHSIEHPFLAL